MAYTTINKSTDYFNTKLYTGNGSTNAITGVGFQPDMCWWKMRSGTEDHALGDAVRTAGYIVKPNSTDAQAQSASYFASFDSDGFTLGSDTKTNGNGSTYASWNWKAGGGQGSSNTDGSINTTYTSANTTSGFSISKVTLSGSGNQTFGHGLGVTPSLVIFKCTSHAEAWFVYHSSLSSPESKYLQLNTTGAASNSSNIWGAGMTSSTVGVNVGVLGTAGQDYIAYCFSQKSGFSSMGSYTGNGNADGSFIYTGFKPAFVLIKDSGRSESWYIFDNRRLGYNGAMADFLANTAAAESSSSATLLDLVSNGFKLRGTTDHLNGSGQNFIYIAFAEAPLVGSNNVPATAR
nr:hypothetical protein [uncultured Mediterranean phage uvMED]